MLSRLAFRLMSLLLLTLSCFPLFAQQFSANMVRLKPEGAPNGKVFVSGDRMRFEVGGPTQGHNSVVIVDLQRAVGFMLLSENKSYVPLPSGPLSMAMPFFHPANPEDGCPAWEKAVGKPGTCTKVGRETVGDRDTVKYQGTAANGDTGYAWVDRKLDFVIKWQGEKGSVEFRNIQEGPQAVTLFEVPKGYDEVDSQAAHKEAAKAKAAKSKALAPKPAN